LLRVHPERWFDRLTIPSEVEGLKGVEG